MSAGNAFALGFFVGAIVMELAWRFLRRLEARLVEEQRDLIREQEAVIERLSAILQAALAKARGGQP